MPTTIPDLTDLMQGICYEVEMVMEIDDKEESGEAFKTSTSVALYEGERAKVRRYFDAVKLQGFEAKDQQFGGTEHTRFVHAGPKS